MSSLSDLIIHALLLGRASGEQWQAGDLAICVKDGWGDDMVENPRLNDLLRVTHVCIGGLFLHFEGKPPGFHWEASAFRKVKPDTEPAADEMWVEQLKQLRAKEPV